MLKHLTTQTKGIIITIFLSIFLALGVVYFFIIRVKQIDSHCFSKIRQDLETDGWPDLGELPSADARDIYEAQVLYIIAEHRRCIEAQHFFYLF